MEPGFAGLLCCTGTIIGHGISKALYALDQLRWIGICSYVKTDIAINGIHFHVQVALVFQVFPDGEGAICAGHSFNLPLYTFHGTNVLRLMG